MILNYPSKICGIEIETDFSFWLQYVGRVIDSIELTTTEKIYIVSCNILGEDYINKNSHNIIEIFTEIMLFYNCNKETCGLTPPNEIWLHWEKDAFTVFADFLLYYKIDLKSYKMHWFDFKAMFDSLPSESKIKTLISIRCEDECPYKGKGQEKERKQWHERKKAAAVFPNIDEYE